MTEEKQPEIPPTEPAPPGTEEEPTGKEIPDEFEIVMRSRDGTEKILSPGAIGVYMLTVSEGKPGVINYNFFTNMPPQERSRSLLFLLGNEVIPMMGSHIEQMFVNMISSKRKAPVVVTGEEASKILRMPGR